MKGTWVTGEKGALDSDPIIDISDSRLSDGLCGPQKGPEHSSRRCTAVQLS